MPTFHRARNLFGRHRSPVVPLAGALATGSILLGCAQTETAPKRFDPDSFVVYPLPPDPARVHFLRSFTGSRDFKKKAGGFDEWLLGQEPEAEKKINKPNGLGAWDGKLYVVDQRGKAIFVFDLVKEELRFMGVSGPGRLERPRALHIDAQGLKYVSDMGRKQVIVFDAQDKFMTAFGMDDPSAEFTPVAATPLGNELYVVDINSHRIAVFDMTEVRFVRYIGSQGSDPGQFMFPYDIAALNGESLLVTDTLNTRIQYIDRNGNVLKTVGSIGLRHGEFVRPKGIDIGPDNVIYVVDAAYEVVQMFNPEGKVLMSFGGPGGEPGNMVLPTAVVVSADPACIEALRPYAHPDFEIEYLILVANQFGTAMVNVYALGAFPPGKDPFEGRPLRSPRSQPATKPSVLPYEAFADPLPGSQPTTAPTTAPSTAPAQPRVIDPLKPSAPPTPPISPTSRPARREADTQPAPTPSQATTAVPPDPVPSGAP